MPSNFVAIYAPNGFGKSSFYDAVEWAITNHLEGLGGEYNKANYDYAARITKEENEGQKILRNKYVSITTPTRVTVSTTRPTPFVRVLGSIKSNQRDLRIGDNKSRENNFFRRVILSQDEIDRFLRETKPQERYTKFMESFGSDSELARKELSILISDNKAELNGLVKQRNLLLEQVKEPVDLSVFEKFNTVALELNASGEKILLADKSYSLQNEHVLNSSLVARLHELNYSLKSHATLFESLTERLSKIPEMELHAKTLLDQQPFISKLTKGVADALSYQSLLNRHSKCASDLQDANERLSRVVEVEGFTEKFFIIESKIIEVTNKLSEANGRRQQSLVKLSTSQKLLKELSDELKTSDDRILLLRNSIENCGPVYSELSMHQIRLNSLGQRISEINVALGLDYSIYSNLESEIGKVSAPNITADLLLTADVSDLQLDKSKLDDLAQSHAELELIAVQDQAIQTTQKALIAQMGTHERLIATGLDYLSSWPSQNCPLCDASHESSEILRNKVKNSTVLSLLTQENSQRLAELRRRRGDLNKRIQDITSEAVKLQVNKKADLRIKLNDLGERRTQAERNKATLLAEQKALETRVNELQTTVWGLSKEELGSRAGAEINSLLIRRQKIQHQLENIVIQVAELNRSVSFDDAELEIASGTSTGLAEDAAYKFVTEFLTENGLAPSELTAHCDLKRKELEALKEERRLALTDLASMCNDLHQTMLDDGTWTDFSLLESQKEALEKELAKSKSILGAFFDSLDRLIAPRVSNSITEARARIIDRIDELNLERELLDSKINGVSLLLELLAAFKPYVKSITLRQELVNVESLLAQRAHVDLKLSVERDAVVDRLKDLINNFFHEDLINSIYRKIDPHPSFKKVEFKVDFDSDKPGLNIVVSDESGALISPILFFSAAQSNILSLSVFLASALHAKDDDGIPVDVIMIDDPIQSMDSINTLSTIDLLRSICIRFNKQIIISTHDENFFGLLQRKIPAEVMGSKFLQLERFGVVVPVDPFLN